MRARREEGSWDDEKKKKLYLLYHLFQYMRICLSNQFKSSDFTELDKLRSKIIGTNDFPGMVDEFPPNKWMVVFHYLLYHLPDQLQYWGPLRLTWAFPDERIILYLKKMIHQTKHPAKHIMINNLSLIALRELIFQTIASTHYSSMTAIDYYSSLVSSFTLDGSLTKELHNEVLRTALYKGPTNLQFLSHDAPGYGEDKSFIKNCLLLLERKFDITAEKAKTATVGLLLHHT